jgi:hypothetical protein
MTGHLSDWGGIDSDDLACLLEHFGEYRGDDRSRADRVCNAILDELERRVGLKRCSKCGRFKDPDDFAADASKKCGRKSLCKACDSSKSQRYYARHRERIKARQNERNRLMREAYEAQLDAEMTF